MPLSFLPERRFRWRHATTIFFVIVVAIAFAEWGYAVLWKDKVLPGVSIGAIDVEEKTPDEARIIIENTIDQLMRAGLSFTYQSKRVTIAPILSAPEDPDLSFALVQWDADAMIAIASAVGHNGPWWQRWYSQTKALIVGEILPAAVTIDETRLRSALEENFSALHEPARDARLVVENKTVTIAEETFGKVFDYTDAITRLTAQLQNLTLQPTTLAITTDYPTITRMDIEKLVPDVETLLTRGPIQFVHGTRWWRIHPEEWNTWLTVTLNTGAPTLTVNAEKVIAALAPIAEEINATPRDAKFVMRDGRVLEFQTARIGKKLSTTKTIDRFVQNVIKGETTTVAVVVEEQKPAATDADVQDLNIVDLIGVGKSNFAGSPVNRRHNIKVGASALNGVLIAPGEEFSLLKTLGEINGEAGYRQELVIKGNRTIPEYGGGLCQIGTTTFRAALASGLPITERQNHSYSVTYYLENGKPGVDATIYGPKPDFKFVNDTGNTILIQTRIQGDNLIFEFWGKKDGRAATRSEPIVTNIRRPPPTKIIETEDLPPGKKKCTERAHTGSTAEFTYTVMMPDGEKREKVFRSVYRPWQEVCLVGKAKTETPAPPASDDTMPTALPSADAEGARGE